MLCLLRLMDSKFAATVKSLQAALRRYLVRTCRYHFIEEWHIPGTREQVAEVILDTHKLSGWWAATFRSVCVTDHGAEDGTGKEFQAVVQGWLPYRLQMTFVITDVILPERFQVQVSGDLEGTGTALLEQQDGVVRLHFDWDVRVRRRLLRSMSPVLKPLICINYLWNMSIGHRRIACEVIRRNPDCVASAGRGSRFIPLVVGAAD